MTKRRTAIDWDSVPLGEEDDGVISRRLGVSRFAVWWQRQQRGIPPYAQVRHERWEKHKHLMGKIPDADLAKIIGVCTPYVADRRRDSGIPPYKDPQSPAELLANHKSILGVWRDADIASMLGLTVRTVVYHRQMAGIPSWRTRRQLINWDIYDKFLGVLPDQAVADIIGCTQPAIVYRRRKLGIPSFTARQKQIRYDMVSSLKRMSADLARTMSDDDIYRNALPSQPLRDSYDWLSKNPDPLNLLHAIMLVDTRTHDLLSRLNSGESGQVWADLKRVQADLKAAIALGQVERAAALLEQMDSLIETGYGDYEIWREVGAMLDQRLRLTKAEWRRRVDMRQMVSVEQLMHLVFTLVGVIREQITDEEVLEAIEVRFSEVVSTQGAEDMIPDA